MQDLISVQYFTDIHWLYSVSVSVCQVDLPGSEGGYEVTGVSCSSCDVTEEGVSLRDDWQVSVGLRVRLRPRGAERSRSRSNSSAASRSAVLNLRHTHIRQRKHTGNTVNSGLSSLLCWGSQSWLHALGLKDTFPCCVFSVKQEGNVWKREEEEKCVWLWGEVG